MPGQEFAKCDQIAANKNAVAFITLSLSIFLLLHCFKMFIIAISTHNLSYCGQNR